MKSTFKAPFLYGLTRALEKLLYKSFIRQKSPVPTLEFLPSGLKSSWLEGTRQDPFISLARDLIKAVIWYLRAKVADVGGYGDKVTYMPGGSEAQFLFRGQHFLGGAESPKFDAHWNKRGN